MISTPMAATTAPNPVPAVAASLAEIRRTAPLVHNITNYVVMNNTANALLAVGASPVMAHALDEMRDFVESHGGMITVEEIKDGVVKVQMLGSCDGCPSSSATLTNGVEEAIRRHWPNFRRLEVVDPDAEAADGGNGHAHAGAEAQPVQLLQIGRKEK